MKVSAGGTPGVLWYNRPGDASAVAKYFLHLDSPTTNHGTVGLNPNIGGVKLEPYVSAPGIAFF